MHWASNYHMPGGPPYNIKRTGAEHIISTHIVFGSIPPLKGTTKGRGGGGEEVRLVQYCRTDSIGKPHVLHRKTCMELIGLKERVMTRAV